MLIIAMFASIVLAYIRPEFILSLLILLAILGILLIKKKLEVKTLVPVIAFSIVMLLIFGLPYSSGRSLTAFGQAYDKNIDFKERVNDGSAKDFNEILNENFGEANSIQDIINSNSDKFFNHIGYNMKRLPNLLLRFKRTCNACQYNNCRL
jgi:energy-coupling factor transporter transmembrane protein EcfT